MSPERGANNLRKAAGRNSARRRKKGTKRALHSPQETFLRRRGKGAGSGTVADELGANTEQQQFVVRSVVFGVLVAFLTGTALYFVVFALKGTRDEPHPAIRASVTYTVKVLETQQKTAEALLHRPALRSLAGEYRLFVLELPDGKVALCAGNFPSGDAEEAQALLAKFRDYALGGDHVFASACIWSYRPEGIE